MLEGCVNLTSSETAFNAALSDPSVRFIGQLDLTKSDLEKTGNWLKEILDQNANYGIRLITKRYPATFACFLVGGGIWHYEEGDYWSFTNTYLEIERDELNGCMYSEVLGTPTLILFDDVPGGAGHVRRVAEEECLTGSP